MKKENKASTFVAPVEFINLFRKVLDYEEGNRAKTVRFLDSDIATQLQVVRFNIDTCLKESEDNPENVKHLTKGLEIMSDVFLAIKTLIRELYPNYIHSIGLEKSMEEYSWRHSAGMARPIHFNSDIPEKKLDSFDMDLQINIYRIYVACQHHLIFNLQVLEFSVNLGLLESEFCFDFVVNKTNPYIKPLTKSDIENKHPFDLETIRARLLLLKGYIGENTDWINRIVIFFPLPE